MKNILIYFDMDKRPSPFDILFAYDVGFDIVLPFSGVTVDEITPLVQDAMFPRGPKGAKYTTIFFGGTDLDVVEKMAINPRRILGIDAVKIEKKAAANLSIIDLNTTWQVDKRAFLSKSQNTPFDGWEVKGSAFGVYNNGQLFLNKRS